MVEHVGMRNALLQQRTGEAPMPGAPTLQNGMQGGFPPGLAPQMPGVDMSAGLPQHLGGDGTHAGRVTYGEYEVYAGDPAPALPQTPPPAPDGQMHLSLNVHPDMSEQDISDAVSQALNAARGDMRGVPSGQLNLSAVAELQLAEHTKLKCPKCDKVQSAKNKKCTECGHDLTDARKAKFANLSTDQMAESIDLSDPDDQALLLALPDFIKAKIEQATDANGDDKAARSMKKVCPECKTKNKADALKCTKCKHSLVGIKARALNAAVAPIDRQQYGPPSDLVGVAADGTLGAVEVATDETEGDESPPNLRGAPPADDPDGDGDTDSCGSCAHFSNDGACLLYDYPVDESQVCDDYEDVDTPIDTLVASQRQPDEGHLAKIYQLSLAQEANKPGVEQDGLVWKIACKSGTLALSPGPGQIDLEQPLNLTGELFRGMVSSLDEKAFPYVTVPETHANGSLENTGYVRKAVVLDQQTALADTRIGQKAKDLIKLDPPDTEYLLAGIEFTEPEVKQKALNGSIPDTSIGVKFGYRNKRTGKLFREAWEHLALTPVPWVDGLPAFGLSGDSPRVVDADEALARYDGVYVDFASREALAEDLAVMLYLAMDTKTRDAKTHKLPDGSFPIDNEEDLKNAISAFGRAKNKGRVKRWISSRAKALGKTDLLPDGWNLSQRPALNAAIVFDPNAHPRDWKGQFRRAVANLPLPHDIEGGRAKPEDAAIKLPDGTTVRRLDRTEYSVTGPDSQMGKARGITEYVEHADKAADKALDKSDLGQPELPAGRVPGADPGVSKLTDAEADFQRRTEAAREYARRSEQFNDPIDTMVERVDEALQGDLERGHMPTDQLNQLMTQYVYGLANDSKPGSLPDSNLREAAEYELGERLGPTDIAKLSDGDLNTLSVHPSARVRAMVIQTQAARKAEPGDRQLDQRGLALAMRVSMRGDPYDPFKAQTAIASLAPGDEWSWNYGVSVRAIAAGDDVDNDAEGVADTDADETYYLLDAGYAPDEDWQRGPTLFRTIDALMSAVSDAVAQQQVRREAQKARDLAPVAVAMSVGQLPGEDLQLSARTTARRRRRGNTPLPEADRTGSLPGELHASATETSNHMSDITAGTVTVEQLLAEQQAKLEALEAENADLRTSAQQASVQLSAQQVETHKGHVQRYLTQKQNEGVPPGLLMAAKTLLMGDVPGREVGGEDGLNLSVTVPQPKADGEGTEQVEKTFRTATEIVDFMLSAVPSVSAQEAARIAALGGQVAEFHLGQHRATQAEKGAADMGALDEWERKEHPERFDSDGKRKTAAA